MTLFIEKYKTLRQNQKIELVDIESRTKINIEYLKALEEGNFDVIHTPYLRLFLRAYINEIGGNADEALGELDEYFEKKSNPRYKKQKVEEEKLEIEEKSDNKEPISEPLEEEEKIIKDHSSNVKTEKKHPRPSISSNILKGLLLLVAWVVIIVIIRNITLDNSDVPAEVTNNNVIENIAEPISLAQLQTDYIETSSQQTALDQDVPFIVKIVSSNPLAIISSMDSLEAATFPIAAGSHQTFAFERNLDIIMAKSDGVSAYVNGDTIQDIRSQNTPVRIIFSTEPKAVTIIHYSRTD